MTEARFFDGRNARAQSVTIHIDNAILNIHAADGPVAAWPVTCLRRTGIDAPGTGATLQLRRGMERLVIADGSFVDILRTYGAPLGRDRRRWGARAWSGFIGGTIASVILAAVLIDRLPSLLVPLVPRSVERIWSSGIETALGGTTRRCVAPAGNGAIARLITRLAAVDDMKPPSFTVLDESAINAFTLPDGRLVIMRGLIDNVGHPDAFAGVLGHELGHVRHRDPTREMLRKMMLNMVARSLGWGGGIGGQMTALSYGRQAEAAADASAIETLQRAGLRADGLARFFDHMQAEGGGNGLPAFLSDHPSMAGRARALSVGHGGAQAMSDVEWAAVKAVCD